MAVMVGQPAVKQFHRPQCCRLVHNSASVAGEAGPAQRNKVFSNSPIFTLERSLKSNRFDTELWNTKAFVAEVHPDLPGVSSLKEWINGSFFRGTSHKETVTDDPGVDDQGKWYVRTVGVQTRSLPEARRHLLFQAGLTEEGSNIPGRLTPEALLILSGSHPARRLPIVSSMFANSIAVLAEGVRLREAGVLPSSVALWAVENPLRHQADRLEQKVAAGAEVVLTQPPLLWDVFEQWMNEVNRRQLSKSTRLVVGLPMISSSANLSFWLRLCDVPLDTQPVKQLLQPFREAEAQGKQAAEEFCRDWNKQLTGKLLDMDGVAGLHVMPLTNLARSFVLEYIRGGLFGQQLTGPQGSPDGVQAPTAE